MNREVERGKKLVWQEEREEEENMVNLRGRETESEHVEKIGWRGGGRCSEMKTEGDMEQMFGHKCPIN